MKKLLLLIAALLFIGFLVSPASAGVRHKEMEYEPEEREWIFKCNFDRKAIGKLKFDFDEQYWRKIKPRIWKHRFVRYAYGVKLDRKLIVVECKKDMDDKDDYKPPKKPPVRPPRPRPGGYEKPAMVIPAPGAIVLGSFGTLLCGWFRRRKII